MSDFIFGGSKITADGDCSHEIIHKSQLDRHGGPGLLAGGVGRAAAQPGPHTITPTGPTIDHKQLCGEVEPDDTPSLHLSPLIRMLEELLALLALCF